MLLHLHLQSAPLLFWIEHYRTRLAPAGMAEVRAALMRFKSLALLLCHSSLLGVYKRWCGQRLALQACSASLST